MKQSDLIMLDRLQNAAFDFFLLCANPRTGLVADTSREGSPSSIAGTGFALSVYPVGVERGWMTRRAAVERTLNTMRFFCDGPADGGFDAIGHRGFCYHFLDMHSGKRAWDSELSMIDTALLVAGMFTAASYFTGDDKNERAIRRLVEKFYRRVEWDWALNGGRTFALGWLPDSGFIPQRWDGYNEGLIMYILGLGSPTHRLAPDDYRAWGETYECRTEYGIHYLFAAPLFIHHFSHAWIDFRGIHDMFMRERKLDYFENSRRAALVQRHYAIDNPQGFTGYGADVWGLSAGDGPSDRWVTAKRRRHMTLGYAARGAPGGPDDGTLMPSATIASLPFTPVQTMKSLRHIRRTWPDVIQNDHVPSGFNPSLLDKNGDMWISDGYYALDQGIMLMMIENHRSNFFWRLLRGNKHIVHGLQRAGFKGGWLDKL